MTDRDKRLQRRLESREIGKQIKAIIQSRGLKLNFVAHELGLSRSRFSLYVNGQRTIPAALKAQLEQYLGISPVTIETASGEHTKTVKE